MEMILPNFEHLLGKYGEELVIHTLKSKRYDNINYLANDEPFAAYDFDVTKNNIKYLCDVKTKKRREAYPDTGIDYKHYLKFKDFIENENNILIFFVDFHEKSKQIYYLNFNKYYKNAVYDNKIMYWDIEKFMVTLRFLEKEEIQICNLYRKSSLQSGSA